MMRLIGLKKPLSGRMAKWQELFREKYSKNISTIARIVRLRRTLEAICECTSKFFIPEREVIICFNLINIGRARRAKCPSIRYHRNAVVIAGISMRI
jgi:hypothetical protein